MTINLFNRINSSDNSIVSLKLIVKFDGNLILKQLINQSGNNEINS